MNNVKLKKKNYNSCSDNYFESRYKELNKLKNCLINKKQLLNFVSIYF